MPRVLITSHSFIARDPRVRRTVQAFLDDGWAVEALVLDEPRSSGNLTISRVPIQRRRGSMARYLFEYAAFFLFMSVWIGRRALGGNIDLIYVNSPPDAFVFAAFLGKLRRIPILLDVHDPMPELFEAKRRRSRLVTRLLQIQERWSFSFADHLVTIHEPLRELFQRRVPGVEMDIVMNVPDASELGTIPWSAKSRTLVYAGSIAFRYGLDDVVRAMGLVGNRIPTLRLRLIGEGEDLGALLDLARAEGVIDRIDAVGPVPYEEVVSAQEGSWVGVNVPKPDGLGSLSFSNKIVEWIAMGLPVIASRSETLLRYFPEGSLFYATPGEPAELAELLLHLDGAGEDEIPLHMEEARLALEAISWPRQQSRLLAAVAEARQQK